MSLRIRRNGKILCTAMHKEESGDIYIDDGLHYILSVEKRIIVTEEWERHSISGEWWWKWNAPKNVKIDEFYGI